jgi:hypothetical protein
VHEWSHLHLQAACYSGCQVGGVILARDEEASTPGGLSLDVLVQASLTPSGIRIVGSSTSDYERG